MKSIVTNNENIYFIVCVRIFNRWKGREIDNYSYWPYFYINSN